MLADLVSAGIHFGEHMTEQDFYDVVLSLFNLRRTPDDGTQEDVLIKTYKPLALVQCARLSDWTFLSKTKVYEYGDELNIDSGAIIDTFREFMFCYRLPKDFVRVMYINGEYDASFQVSGNTIWTKERVGKLDYVSSDTKNAPEDYMYLVAYYVAMSISQMLDSSGTAMTRAQNLVAVAVSGLQQTEAANKRQKRPDIDSYIFDRQAKPVGYPARLKHGNRK